MKPLICEALWKTQQSRAEKGLMWIPFIGWAIAATLEQARFRPFVQSIERQLSERPDPSEFWGTEPRRRELSTSLRVLIKEEFGWINDHFIPDDPFGIAFWGHEDGLDDVSAVRRIKEEFGFEQSDSEWERFWFHGTLGEFVDGLISDGCNAP